MKRTFSLIFVVIIMTGLTGIPQSTSSAQMFIYVSANGCGTACIESAPCSLQYAASLNLSPSNIYMEEGIYTAYSGDEVAKFTETTWILGSCVFDGNDTTPPDCGYQDSHRSIINGEYLRRGLVMTGNDTSLNNFYILNVDIINGRASSADTSQCTDAFGDPGGCGGGLFIDRGNIVYLYHMTFDDNKAGGNSTDLVGYGGGVYVQDSTKFTVDDCTFTDNYANVYLHGFGGGIFTENVGSDIVAIQGSEFISNNCSGNENGTASRGCGVMVYNSEDVIIEENVFHLNNPYSFSGVKGTALYIDDNHSFDIHGNSFTSNSGGISVVGADNSSNTYSSAIDANYFRDNSSFNLIQHEGGYWVKVTNNFLIHNNPLTSSTRGGPAYSAINLTSNYGSPIKSIANIYHNSISGGSYGMNIGDNLMVIIKNNIISYTEFEGIIVPAAPVNFVGDYKTNLFWQNMGGLGIDDPTSIIEPPEFIDKVSDLHVSRESSAVDAGTTGLGVETDYDGQARPAGGYDIGADEVWWESFLPMIIR